MLKICDWHTTDSLDVCVTCCADLSGGQGGLAARVAAGAGSGCCSGSALLYCIVIIIDSVPLGHLLSLPGISMTRQEVRVELVQEHPSDLRDVIASSLAIR